jgi:hypothetical protein
MGSKREHNERSSVYKSESRFECCKEEVPVLFMLILPGD